MPESAQIRALRHSIGTPYMLYAKCGLRAHQFDCPACGSS